MLFLTAAIPARGVFVLIARPREPRSWTWHVSAVGSLVVVAAVVAVTGGADSPARFYLFLLVYAAYFFRRHDALPYVLGCIATALLPLLYDEGAVAGGYIGELIVVCPA